MYRLVAGRWVQIANATVAADAHGIAHYRVDFPVAGSYYYRAYAPATATNASSVWSPMERWLAR